MIKPLRDKNTIVPLDKVSEALKEFEITPEELAISEEEKARQNNAPALEQKLDDRISCKKQLPRHIGYARVEHDLSKDYAQFLHFHRDLEKTERTEEGVLYCFKGGGAIEMRFEISAIGRTAVYFNNCPKGIYEGLISLEERIVRNVNERYK